MSEESDIVMSVTDALTGDVLEGVMMYGLATGELSEANRDRAQRWVDRLFRDNPVGGGLFATAHLDGRLIGFFCVIDFEMLIDGKPAKAGKGEFWVVPDEALKLRPRGSRDRLPWAIFALLRHEAGKFGYRALLFVSRMATRYLMREGDTCIAPELFSYSTPGPPPLGPLGYRLDRLAPGWRLKAATRRMSRKAGGHMSRVSVIDRLEVPVGYAYRTALVSSGQDMINSRFPASHNLKLLLERAGDTPLLFVFSRPQPGGEALLLHASGMPDSLEDIAAVLAVAMREATGAGARAVTLDLMEAQPHLLALGLSPSRKTIGNCFVMDTRIAAPLPPASGWHVSHAHLGFYGYIG